METRKITTEQQQMLNAPLPAEAVKPHPTKNYLSTIKAIYVTERLNQVFGIGTWRVRSEHVVSENKMVVVKVMFEIPEYGIYYECYGGNDNNDLGDAYKGAVTDALTKIGSWLGIGADVFKGKATGNRPTQPAAKPKKAVTNEMLDNVIQCDAFLKWAYNFYLASSYDSKFDAGARLLKSYDASDAVVERFRTLFESYKIAQKNGTQQSAAGSTAS